MEHYVYIAAGVAGAALLSLLALVLRRRNRAAPCTVTGRASGRPSFGRGFRELLGRPRMDEGFLSELESTLVCADAGLAVTERLVEAARGERTPADVRHRLTEEMVSMLRKGARGEGGRPHVILVLGVNGVGKTTTIAKLARAHKGEGRRVLLVACDTFRAAAVEQLQQWGAKLGCEVVAQAQGADAASVAFDGVSKACSRGHDVVIIDTAGRMHTKHNLMEELKKIRRVIGKACPGAPHDRLMVIDATVGQNGLAQARQFHDAVGLTGAIVTKLDSTAKGGFVLAVAGELGVPITHIGLGEGMGDLRDFDARDFVDSILS